MILKSFKHFIAVAAVIASAATANAVPAKPQWLTVSQPDGTEITVRTYGDEHFHYTMTDDNRLVIPGNDGFYRYATVAADGKVVASEVIAARPESMTTATARFVATLPSAETMIGKAFEARKARDTFRSPARVPSNMLTSAFPSTGEQPVLVVLVEFKDKKFTVNNPQDYYTRMLNEEGFSDDGGTGSARDYFLDCSGGRFQPRFDVYRPITLANNMSYYGGNDSQGDDLRPEQMAIEACQALDPEVDFKQYDRDGDGFIDNVFVIYAGYGEADGGAANTVWPHAFWIYKGAGKRIILDGKYLDHYACSNEMSSANRPCGIGTTCHEFSHVMGLPDLYVTDYNAYYNTPGTWSVIDSGCYNNDGRTPPVYSAFERLSLGWIDPVEIKQASQVMVPNLNDNVAFIINTSNDNEFFLFENRQQSGWDQFLPGHGMLIWRISYDKRFWDSNAVNNYATQRVDIIEAGGSGAYVPASAYTWPGSRRKTSFTSSTSPAFVTSTGDAMNFPITDITEADELITFSVLGGKNRIATPATPTASDISGSRAVISWPAVEGASDYYITLSAEGGFRTILNHVATSGANTYELTGLEPGTTHFVSVMAVGNSCVSNESPIATFATTEPVFADARVKLNDPTAITETSFTAEWQPLNQAETYYLTVDRINPATAFEITAGYDNATMPEGWTSTASGKYVGIPDSYGAASPSLRINKIGEYVETPVMDGNITYLSFWLRGRSEGATLNFVTVSGLNASGAWEKISDVTIALTSRTVEIPISGSYKALKLEYTGSATGSNPIGIDDITIRGGEQASKANVINDLNVGNVTSYRVTGLDSGANYTYKVRASSGDIFSLYSLEGQVTTGGQAGIDDIIAGDDVTISGGEFITISGSDADATVYNLQGNIVYNGPRRTISLPAGLYIVKVAHATAKVIVR